MLLSKKLNLRIDLCLVQIELVHLDATKGNHAYDGKVEPLLCGEVYIVGVPDGGYREHDDCNYLSHLFIIVFAKGPAQRLLWLISCFFNLISDGIIATLFLSHCLYLFNH